MSIDCVFPVAGRRQNCIRDNAFTANGTTDGLIAAARVIHGEGGGQAVVTGTVSQPGGFGTPWTVSFANFTPPVGVPLVLIVTSADVNGPVEAIIRFEHVPAVQLTLTGNSLSNGFTNTRLVRFTGTTQNAATLLANVEGTPTADLLSSFQIGVEVSNGDGAKNVEFTATSVGAGDPAVTPTAITVNLDTTPPTLSGIVVNSLSPFAISVTVADTASGVNTTTARIQDDSGHTFSVFNGAGTFQFSPTPSLTVTSAFVVVFTSVDNAGNSVDLPFLVQPAPEVAISFTGIKVNETTVEIKGAAANAPKLSATATGSSNLSFTYDEAAETWTLTMSANGDVDIAFQAADAQNNPVGAPVHFHYVAETEPPVASVQVISASSLRANYSNAMADSAFAANAYTILDDNGNPLNPARTLTVSKVSPTQASISISPALDPGDHQLQIANTVKDIADNALSDTNPLEFTVAVPT